MNLPIPILSVLDRRGDFVFRKKTVLALRGGRWILPREWKSRLILSTTRQLILSLSVAIVFGFIGALLALFSPESRDRRLPVFSRRKLALALVTAFLVHGSIIRRHIYRRRHYPAQSCCWRCSTGR